MSDAADMGRGFFMYRRWRRARRPEIPPNGRQGV